MHSILFLFISLTKTFPLKCVGPSIYRPCILSNKENNAYKYKSKERKIYKNYMNYTGYVQDHHCIPYQYRNHPLINQIAYNVNTATNILIMPNKKGIRALNLDPKTLVHDGGHDAYNKYVGKQLDIIYKEPTLDMKKYRVWLFLSYLKENMQFNRGNVPWK